MRTRLRIIAMLAVAVSCAGAGTTPPDQPRSASSDSCWRDNDPYVARSLDAGIDDRMACVSLVASAEFFTGTSLAPATDSTR